MTAGELWLRLNEMIEADPRVMDFPIEHQAQPGRFPIHTKNAVALHRKLNRLRIDRGENEFVVLLTSVDDSHYLESPNRIDTCPIPPST